MRKHGISFEEAIEIFDGPVLSRADDIHGEARERSYGLIKEVVVVCVVHTERGAARRIIANLRAEVRTDIADVRTGFFSDLRGKSPHSG